MVKFLLLALAFGLAHAQVKIDGNWVTLAIAANNVDKVVLEGPLRVYVREITCNEECSEMEITFYVNLNGQCSKTKVTGYKQADGSYRTQYEGDNKYELTYLTATHAVFKSKNVDRAAQKQT
ncbi:odorant-binding protein-like [Peromyscus leucopus]|uniref:odorant-binding protein-like n=1 Tax=Peromyscus leucopus TaxID=10041 RepID=UPI0018856CC5|nr:odorant-binding protein-like [Peromyscus leucopus]